MTENFKLIPINGKHSGFAKVDSENYEWLSKYRWHMKGIYVHTKYNIADENGVKRVKNNVMHRMIMKTPEGLQCDHINHDTFDNRKENLRNITAFENSQNSIKVCGYLAPLAGNRWKACTSFKGTPLHLGCYDTQQEAYEALDMFVIHEKHTYRTLHFPEKEEEYRKRPYERYQKEETTNKYYGVYHYTKGGDRYFSQIQTGKGKMIYLITHVDPVVCAKAVDKYVVEHNIKGRVLNFPEDYPEFDTRLIQTLSEPFDENSVTLIPNGQRKAICLIDKEDYEKIKYLRWFIDCFGYLKEKKLGLLHRYLLEASPKLQVDHINGVRTDNRRCNIRIVTAHQNAQNKSKPNKDSGYFGVSKTKTKDGELGSWRANFQYKGKTTCKMFPKIVDAARWRDLTIMKIPDHNFRLNFEWTTEDIELWKKKLKIN